MAHESFRMTSKSLCHHLKAPSVPLELIENSIKVHQPMQSYGFKISSTIFIQIVKNKGKKFKKFNTVGWSRQARAST